MGAKQSRKKLQRQLNDHQEDITRLQEQFEQLNDNQKEITRLQEQFEQSTVNQQKLREELHSAEVKVADLQANTNKIRPDDDERQREPKRSGDTQLTSQRDSSDRDGDDDDGGGLAESHGIDAEGRPGPVTTSQETTAQLVSLQALLAVVLSKETRADNQESQRSRPRNRATARPTDWAMRGRQAATLAHRGAQATTTPWGGRSDQPVNPGRVIRQPVRGGQWQTMQHGSIQAMPHVSILRERREREERPVCYHYFHRAHGA